MLSFLGVWKCTCTDTLIPAQAKCIECGKLKDGSIKDGYISKKKKQKQLIYLPLDLIFEIARYLSICHSRRMSLCNKDLNVLPKNDEFSERWWENVMVSNVPSLSLFTHPSLNTSGEKLMAHNRNRSIAPVEAAPDLSHILMDCRLYCRVSTPESGDTIICGNCTLINAFGRNSCSVCSRRLDYTGVGTTETLLHTRTTVASDGSFHYPPLEQVEAEKILTALRDGTPFVVRSFLFDSKTNRTFAPYEGIDDDGDDGNVYFESMKIQSNQQQPHINILVNRADMNMYIRLGISSGDTDGKINLFDEEGDSIDDSIVDILYLFSKSVTAEVPTLLLPQQGQLPFVSQSAMIETGQTALFLLADSITTIAQDIAAAEINIASIISNDTNFIISIRKDGSDTVLFYSTLLAEFDSVQHCLIFKKPEFNAFIKDCGNVFDDIGMHVEIYAVSLSRSRMYQLANGVFEPEWEKKDNVLTLSDWEAAEVDQSSAFSRWNRTYAGRMLDKVYNYEGLPLLYDLNIEKNNTDWNLNYNIYNIHTGLASTANFLDCYLQLLIDGSVSL